MKVVKSTKNVTFNLPLSGQLTAPVYGALNGQYFNGQVDKLDMNIDIFYLSPENRIVFLRRGVKSYSSEEMNTIFTSQNENFCERMSENFYNALKTEMFDIFKDMNNEITIEDFEVAVVEHVGGRPDDRR